MIHLLSIFSIYRFFDKYLHFLGTKKRSWIIIQYDPASRLLLFANDFAQIRHFNRRNS